MTSKASIGISCINTPVQTGSRAGGTGGEGGPTGPPRGRQMDRKAGEEEVSGEKQWGGAVVGEKNRMLGRKTDYKFPSHPDRGFHLLSSPERYRIPMQVGKLRL